VQAIQCHSCESRNRLSYSKFSIPAYQRDDKHIEQNEKIMAICAGVFTDVIAQRGIAVCRATHVCQNDRGCTR
jgi:hypothetical protein